MEAINILFLLLAGIWGAFGMIVRVFVILNERRDSVLGIEDRRTPLPAEKRALLLWNDWLPLWLGTGLFLALVATLFALLPQLQTKDSGVLILGLDVVEFACYLGSVLAGCGFLLNALAGGSDFRLMKREVRLIRQEAATTHEFPSRLPSARGRSTRN